MLAYAIMMLTKKYMASLREVRARGDHCSTNEWRSCSLARHLCTTDVAFECTHGGDGEVRVCIAQSLHSYISALIRKP